MAILGDFEVTIVVNDKPTPEYPASYVQSSSSQPDTVHTYISATDVDFAIDYKVRCGEHFISPVPCDYIVFRTKFDGLKYGTAHVARARYIKPGSYRVRKRGKRHHENGGWHFREYHFFTADLTYGRPPLSLAVGDIYVPNVIKVEVWMEMEYAKADAPNINGRPVSSSSDWSIVDLTNPFHSWGKNTTQPPRVRYTGSLDTEPLATFVFENCSPGKLFVGGRYVTLTVNAEALQAMGNMDEMTLLRELGQLDTDELTLIEAKDVLMQEAPSQVPEAHPLGSSPSLDEPQMLKLTEAGGETIDLSQDVSDSTPAKGAVEVIDLTDL